MGCREEIKQTQQYYPRSCPDCGFGPYKRANDLDPKIARKLDFFMDALKIKLLRAQEAGRTGWDSRDWKEECQVQLLKHVRKGDPLDVAAYAFFCHHNFWPTWPENET
jgi:hypothetical protein